MELSVAGYWCKLFNKIKKKKEQLELVINTEDLRAKEMTSSKLHFSSGRIISSLKKELTSYSPIECYLPECRKPGNGCSWFLISPPNRSSPAYTLFRNQSSLWQSVPLTVKTIFSSCLQESQTILVHVGQYKKKVRKGVLSGSLPLSSHVQPLPNSTAPFSLSSFSRAELWIHVRSHLGLSSDHFLDIQGVHQPFLLAYNGATRSNCSGVSSLFKAPHCCCICQFSSGLSLTSPHL